MKYDFSKAEKHWQKIWEKEKIYTADDNSKKAKKYVLIEFPYPSGEGLHMGHLRPYTAGDVYSRFMRMNGYDVLYPIGWDAFGLPAENYAIKKGVHPSVSTAKNISNAKAQLKSWGVGFDWSREINTTDPDYYKWTQWLFLQFFKAGLAYEAEGLINWCPKDKTGLANEEVINGCCERCGTRVEKKKLRQWYLKITAYAEKLLQGLKKLDWPERIKLQQKNWIGKSEGAEIEFPISARYNYVLLHGFTETAEGNFFPWLIEELKKRGAKVYAPNLPHTNTPTEKEQVEFVLKNAKFDENTILFGHSLGSVVALKVAEKLERPIAGLVTAGGFMDMKRRTYFKPRIRAYDNAFIWKFDVSRIKRNCGFIETLAAINDDSIDLETNRRVHAALGGQYHEVTAEDLHSTAKKEPFILEALVPSIKVFTTRPDTLFGATYMVLAPEHPLIKNLEFRIKNLEEVKKYIKKAESKSEEERIAEGKEKTGVELKGIKAINPATKEEIPVWIADYVLVSYGTGAIMAVPAHDERDYKFAKQYKLPIKQVIQSKGENCVIVHGCPSTPENNPQKRTYDKHWIPWIKQKLERAGISTYTPLMPQPWNPIYKEWEKEFEKLPINEYTTLVGHSCGAAFLVKWLGETKRSVKKLILVAGAKIPKEGNHAKDDLFDFEISKSIQNQVKETVIFLSNDDKLNLKSAKIYATALNARTIKLKNMGHFTFKEMHTEEFPELIAEILNFNHATTDYGRLINSRKFTGMDSETAKWEITKFVGGLRKIQYRLRDWVFSRQRYWGEPIPLIHCQKCGIVPVPEKDLPVKLPDAKKYEPTGTGESPLAAIKSWVNVNCPKCDGPGRRETNTMPQWAGSSWYYLRYCDPKNKKEFAGQKLMKRWLPVDVYFGGLEHTTLHLLYSRFWHLFLYDKKLVPTSEPYAKRVPHGIILGPDGEKMSKSRGNVVSPDNIIREFGADCLRMYELFLGPHEATISWNPQGILGISRFLERVYKKFGEPPAGKSPKNVEQSVHRAVKKIEDDTRSVKFNTAISVLMICLNEIEEQPLTIELRKMFLKLLAPFAPHISEELWQTLAKSKEQRVKSKFTSIHLERWPKYDPELIKEETFTLVIQVNGKVRDSMEASIGMKSAEAEELALSREKIKNLIGTAKPRKVVYVPNRLINIVI